MFCLEIDKYDRQAALFIWPRILSETSLRACFSDTTSVIRACGAMDNASAYGAEDSRFESWHARRVNIFLWRIVECQRIFCNVQAASYNILRFTMHWRRPKQVASAGNRTRVARVAGEHSTTEPPMRRMLFYCKCQLSNYCDVTWAGIFSTS